MTVGRALRLLGRFAVEGMRPIAPAPHHPHPETWSNAEITGAWLGHSTVLLNFFGLWVITDPVLAPRCGLRLGPLTVGPRRRVQPALRVRELPEIDVVLLSHAHMDHLDLWTLRRLRGRPHAVTAAGLRDLLRGMPFSGITELPWDEGATIETRHGELTVSAREVAHWGARMQTDDWRGYCGFLMERNGRKIGFAGDTARTSFRHWANGSEIDLMAMPIGAYNPWVHAHCNPEEAVEMAGEARARLVLPIHHSTFRLSAEPADEPITRFRAALEKERIAGGEVGQTFWVSGR
jgi:L-ascorbate metabolism protein UlaG (beta-lactamase superfamily)